MGLSSKPTDMDQKKEDNVNSSPDQTAPLSSRKASLNAGLGPEKSSPIPSDQFSFLIQCHKHEGWQTTSKSTSLQDAINTFSDLAINDSETGIRLIKVTLGPNKSQNQADVVFRIEGEELVAASKGNFDLTRLGKSLLVDDPKKETQPETHDLLAPNPDVNDEEIGFPPLQAEAPRRNGKKTTITLIAWASLFIGAAAVGVTLSDISTDKLIAKIEPYIPEIGDGYKSIIHEGDNQPKTVEAGTLGAKNARDILEELQGDYSPNLLQKPNSDTVANEIPQNNVTSDTSSELTDSLIAPPPVADLVLKNVDPVMEQEANIIKTDANMSTSNNEFQQVEIEKPPIAELTVDETKASSPEIIRAPEKPEPPQLAIAETTDDQIVPTDKVNNSTDVEISEQTLTLEDLTMGFTWSDTKESLGDVVLNCLNITESIEGCRMDAESWLSDTRYIVGLFNREKGGRLIALQIDSQPFLTTSYALKSFGDATDAITNKLPNNSDFLKEVEVADKQKLFSTLSTYKQARHYKHWSLVELGVPAYIHLSVKAIDQSSGFHRTIIAAVTE